MAVRIIDEGPDPSIVKQAICGNCGAKMEYTPQDVQSRHGQDYSGGPDGCEFIKCPKCNAAVVLKRW